MYNPYEGNPHKHRFRFYIVVITLVLGVVMFLFLMDSSTKTRLTGAVSGFSGSSSTEPTQIAASKLQGSDKIMLNLSFNQLPAAVKDFQVSTIKLKVNELDSRILINDDELELNNVDEVNIDVSGFSGEAGFSTSALSLQGIAKKIEINGVALSSPKDKLKISFKNLHYEYLDLQQIKSEDLRFPNGQGLLSIGNKLSYDLTREDIDIKAFSGDMIIVDQTLLEGEAQGLSVSGSLNLVLS